MTMLELTPKYCDHIPNNLEPGIIYISKKFFTSIHLCACGNCNMQTVLPFKNKATGWEFIEHEDGTVSFSPSIGNYSFPCKSHYFIERNRVRWC